MLNSPTLPSRDLSSLRIVITGGASAAVETIKAFQAAVPHARLLELYGMLETGYHCFTRLTDDPLEVNGTVGHCVEEMGLRIIDDDGADVPFGEVGEIAAVGPSVHMGYLDNPVVNQEAFTADGWFRTGDLGQFVDKAGNVRIAGRKKEIVNRGGRKLDPREVEELLRRHPDVGDAAAFPIPHPSLGEDLAAAVVLKADAVTAPQELRAYLFQKAAGYKVPSRILVLEDIPRGATGKLERRRLAALLDGQLRTAFVAPRSALEAEIATIFAEVLQLAEVGAEDNFFALGGDSLRLLELILCLRSGCTGIFRTISRPGISPPPP